MLCICDSISSAEAYLFTQGLVVESYLLKLIDSTHHNWSSSWYAFSCKSNHTPAQNKNLSFQEKQRNLAKFDDLIGTLQRRKCNPYPWSGNLYFPSKFLYYRVWGLTLKINLLVIIIWKSKLKTIHVHTRNIS